MTLLRTAPLVSLLAFAGTSEAIAQAPLDFVIDSGASAFTFNGSTTLGPIVGSPNSFNLFGNVVAELTSGATQPIGTIEFTGGGNALVSPDINATVPNPVIFLPPLATITITNLRLDVTSNVAPVDAAGNFTATVISNTLSGIATVTPLGGSPSVSDLAGSMSTPQAFSANVTSNASSATISGPLNLTFMLVDPGTGLTATVNLMGALSATHMGPPTTNYCSTNANSSGAPASIGSMGSSSISRNDLSLTANALPQFSLGYFLLSESQGFVANFGGSQGNLCLGGSIFRLSSFIQNSTGSGQVSLALPYGGLPAGATIDPGESWNFQYWFRDSVAGSPTSNTSDGLTVTFLP